MASEKAWLTAEKVWLVHKKGFTAARVLKSAEGLSEGRCKVKLEHNGQELEVDEDDIEKVGLVWELLPSSVYGELFM